MSSPLGKPSPILISRGTGQWRNGVLFFPSCARKKKKLFFVFFLLCCSLGNLELPRDARIFTSLSGLRFQPVNNRKRCKREELRGAKTRRRCWKKRKKVHFWKKKKELGGDRTRDFSAFPPREPIFWNIRSMSMSITTTAVSSHPGTTFSHFGRIVRRLRFR